jgi:peptide/nickel transport system substrate-binding protein
MYQWGAAYPIAFPKVVNHELVGWYCEPVTITDLPIPNGTIVTCVNSTFGYFNTTNWQDAEWAAEPGSEDLVTLGKVLFAW